MNFYDVVIVGAGPAGASAARELVKNGRRLLIIGKRNYRDTRFARG